MTSFPSSTVVSFEKFFAAPWGCEEVVDVGNYGRRIVNYWERMNWISYLDFIRACWSCFEVLERKQNARRTGKNYSVAL